MSEDKNFISKANEKRGLGYHEQAIDFIRQFPIGTTLSPRQFDDWSCANGSMPAPATTEKGSEGWMAHLQRRHQFRYSLNKAGAHPRMTRDGLTPFVIETLSQGTWTVRSTHGAIQHNRMSSVVISLVTTKKRQLRHLIESTDWESLPVAERVHTEDLLEGIEDYAKRVQLDGELLHQRFERLGAKLRRLTESGAIKSRNGGIKAITDGKLPDDDDDNNDGGSTPSQD